MAARHLPPLLEETREEMNPWFYCGRDLMWFSLAYLPIILSLQSGESGNTDGVALALIIQTTGIALLYFGVIK